MGLFVTSEQPQGVDLEAVRRAGDRGRLGILFTIIGAFIPYVGVVLDIVGLVLLLLALNDLSRELSDERIFRYAIYAVVVGIASSLLIGVGLAVSVLLHPLYPGDAVIGLVVAAYVVVIVLGYLYRAIYSSLSERTLTLSSEAWGRFSSAARWY